MAKTKGLVLVIILSVWAIVPFFQPGFFPMHDDTQMVRVSQMAKALSDGHFPVRWVKDLGYGYGYPLFNFYAPLAYYVGGFINLFGFNVLDSTKVMMVIGILLSGVFMYLLAREFWGELGGVVSGLFYMYAPYHAVDIYVRGAVGELWAYGFLPLMAFGIYKISKTQLKNQKEIWNWIVIDAVGFSGVILSHNLTAMMVIPFLTIFLLVQLIANKNVSRIKYHVSSILLGLGISAFYWLPALVEFGYTNVQSQIGGGADFRDHFVCVQQLWDSPWGFGGSAPGCLDGLSLKIGKLHIATAILALLVGLYVWKKDRQRSAVVLVASGFSLFAVFMMLEIARPIWEVIAPLAFLQYPWRFLLLVSFFVSFVTGVMVWFLRKSPNISLVTAGILLLFLFYSNGKLFQPHFLIAKSTDDYLSDNHVKWVTSKISDEYMPRDFAKPSFAVDTVKRRVAGGQITVDKTQELVFEINEGETKTVLVSIAPFPAWQALIDGIPSSYASRQNGIVVSLPQGPHVVKLLFRSTQTETVANIISIVSILVLLGGILKRYGKS